MQSSMLCQCLPAWLDPLCCWHETPGLIYLSLSSDLWSTRRFFVHSLQLPFTPLGPKNERSLYTQHRYFQQQIKSKSTFFILWGRFSIVPKNSEVTLDFFYYSIITSIKFLIESFHQNSLFFPWYPYPKTDGSCLLILFTIKDLKNSMKIISEELIRKLIEVL